jgi:outer membrane protein assembly factor BamB
VEAVREGEHTSTEPSCSPPAIWLFFGDLAQHLRALDQETGKALWDETLPGPIANSTITYAVNGRQYVAVYTGDGQLPPSVVAYNKELKSARKVNTIRCSRCRRMSPSRPPSCPRPRLPRVLRKGKPNNV